MPAKKKQKKDDLVFDTTEPVEIPKAKPKPKNQPSKKKSSQSQPKKQSKKPSKPISTQPQEEPEPSPKRIADLLSAENEPAPGDFDVVHATDILIAQETAKPAVIPTAEIGCKGICTCGHTGDGSGSQHAESKKGLPGMGACTVDGCRCSEFQFKRWL